MNHPIYARMDTQPNRVATGRSLEVTKNPNMPMKSGASIKNIISHDNRVDENPTPIVMRMAMARFNSPRKK